MARRMVNVVILGEGISYPGDVTKGVLLENGKVFLNNGEPAVYNAIQAPAKDFVFVDMVKDGRDYLEGDSALLKLVLGGGGK